MQTITFKCPCCGAPLQYDGESRQLTCASCGNEFEADSLSAMREFDDADEQFGEMDWRVDAKSYADMPHSHTYTCQSCGAELVTDENTTATQCAYCGSPIILTSNLKGGTRPEAILPFRVTEEEARKMFQDYFHGRRLIPNVFLNTQNRIAEIRRLYVPYWLFSGKADANLTYDATRTFVTRTSDYETIRTQHFLVRRTGSLAFEGIPVDGSERLDNRITESIEPYDFAESIDFEPATLAGSLADRADVSAENCRDRANERLRESTRSAFRDTVIGFDTVVERSCHIRVADGQAIPVLLPVWLIRTEKMVKGEKKTYTFAINGQTGKLTCDIPCSISKAAQWFFGLTAAIGAGGYVLTLILAALGVFGGGV